MKEVATFNVFIPILQYIINRLRNHSILVKSEHNSKGMILASMIGTPQFKIFTSDIDVKVEEIEYVLDFLTWFDNDKTSPNGMIHYVKVSDGCVVTVKTMGHAGSLQNMYDNILLLKNHEQTDFIDAISEAKLNPSILNNDTEIFAKVFEAKQEFPMISNNKDGYHEATIKVSASSINAELQAIVQKNHQDRQKGGKGSYQGNRKLQPVVNNLVVKRCTEKQHGRVL